MAYLLYNSQTSTASSSISSSRPFSTSSNNGPFKVVINGTTYNAVAVYNNPFDEKSCISKDLRDKAGVYAWINKTSGKAYVGSSYNLNKRISYYFQPSYKSNNANSIIVRAMLKYGLINFNLVILEFTDIDKNTIQAAEQKYLDSNDFDYNVLKTAGTTLGYRRSKEAKAKVSGTNNHFYGKTHSKESRNLMSAAKAGSNHHMLGKNHSEETRAKMSGSRRGVGYNATSNFVTILDIETNITTSFVSLRQAAQSINSDPKTLSRLPLRKNPLAPYRGRYIITINNS